jgi:hypothetical protein
MTKHIEDRSGPFLEMSLAEMLDRIKRAGTRTAPSPLKVKPPATPAKSSGDPTPERMAKEPEGFDTQTMKGGTVYTAAEVMHRVRSPLNSYRPYFSRSELAIAEVFCSDAEAASITHVTVNYGGQPRSPAGSRHGGVDDRKRGKYLRFMQVMEAMPDQSRAVLLSLVLEVRDEASGRPLSIQTVGKALSGARGDELAKGVGLGALKATLWMLHQAYRAHEIALRRR